jgi:hypothetical protein
MANSEAHPWFNLAAAKVAAYMTTSKDRSLPVIRWKSDGYFMWKDYFLLLGWVPYTFREMRHSKEACWTAPCQFPGELGLLSGDYPRSSEHMMAAFERRKSEHRKGVNLLYGKENPAPIYETVEQERAHVAKTLADFLAGRKIDQNPAKPLVPGRLANLRVYRGHPGYHQMVEIAQSASIEDYLFFDDDGKGAGIKVPLEWYRHINLGAVQAIQKTWVSLSDAGLRANYPPIPSR